MGASSIPGFQDFRESVEAREGKEKTVGEALSSLACIGREYCLKRNSLEGGNFCFLLLLT